MTASCFSPSGIPLRDLGYDQRHYVSARAPRSRANWASKPTQPDHAGNGCRALCEGPFCRLGATCGLSEIAYRPIFNRQHRIPPAALRTRSAVAAPNPINPINKDKSCWDDFAPLDADNRSDRGQAPYNVFQNVRIVPRFGPHHLEKGQLAGSHFPDLAAMEFGLSLSVGWFVMHGWRPH